MKILKKYLLREFFKYIGAALVSLAAFYVVVDFIANIGAFTKHSPQLFYIILYYFYKLPEIIYRVLPLSVLLSTLLAISSFKKNNEITAVKSSGVSMVAFFTPLFICGVAISLFAFFLSNFIMVKANVRNKIIMEKYISGRKNYNVSSVFKYKTENILIHYKHYIITAESLDPAKKIIKGVNVYVFGKNFSLTGRYMAKTGYFNGNGGNKKLVLEDGRLDEFIFKNKTEFKEELFKKTEVPVKLNLNFFKSYNLKPELLSIISLSKMLEVASKSGEGLDYLLTGFYSKLSYPLINLILIFVGISVGLLLENKGSSAIAIGISLMVAFVWWIINSIALSLGEASQLNPFLAGFMADIIFLLFAVYLITDID